MLRFFSFCFAALLGLSQLASAASISAVLMPTFAVGSGAPTLTGYYERTITGIGTIQGYIGPVMPRDFEGKVVFEEVVFAGASSRLAVRTDLTEVLGANTRLFKLTTYAWFQYDTTPPLLNSDNYYVQNKAYLEFTVNGNYDWNIQGSDPLASQSTNRRTFSFVKVVNGVEQLPPLASNAAGTGASNIGSTAEIGTGTYRLYFDHNDTHKYIQSANATNLDILFTFKSEDGSGGGTGVVPEPSSVAVFGLLGVGSVVAKWRRNKLQSAS